MAKLKDTQINSRLNIGGNGNIADYVIGGGMYDDGTWFRTWKSGFKECGGTDTINENSAKTLVLPITYSSSNFVCLISNNANINGASTEGILSIRPDGKNSVIIKAGYTDPNTVAYSWMTRGY